LKINGDGENNLIGYYFGEECHECAGFGIGSIANDLKLNKDSTFIFRNIAIRFSHKDIISILKMEGKWYSDNIKLYLKPTSICRAKVDSIYSVASVDCDKVDSKKPVCINMFKERNNNKLVSRCTDIFIRQDKRRF
jgi:hypothetical protein